VDPFSTAGTAYVTDADADVIGTGQED